MLTNKSVAELELEKQLKHVKDMFKAHLDGYLANVLDDLNQTIEMIISDYESLDANDNLTGRVDLSVDSLKRIFLTGKSSLKDKIEEFWDHKGDSPFDRYEDLDTVLDKLDGEMQGHLKDDESETHAAVYDDLKHAAEQYRLSDSQYWQDELKKILENEYNLALIVAPANNQ